MEGCSQGELLWKANVVQGYIYRRMMTCTVQEAIIRLPSTLVRYLLNTMPGLSHFEMWEPRAGNDVTGNPYLEWILEDLDRWRQPCHRSPPSLDCRWEKGGCKGKGVISARHFSPTSWPRIREFSKPILPLPLAVKVKIPAWALSLQRLEGLA